MLVQITLDVRGLARACFRGGPDVSDVDRVPAVRSTLGNSEFGMDAALRGLRERGYYPPVVMDIGAAIGGWTKLASRYWPRSHFFCNEALEERRRDLEALARRGGTDITILMCGVADEDGVFKMGVTESLWDSSFAYEGKEARELRVFCLDTLLAEELIKPPSFLKLDVQGFETRIIRGGRAALKVCDVILMECAFYSFCSAMQTLDQTIGFMASHDYVPYEFVDLLRRPLDGAMGQCDLVFVRKNHWLVAQKSWA